VGFLDTPGVARGIDVSGTFAYIGDGNAGLRVINVANPAAPVSIGSIDTPDDARGLAVSGTIAYLADNNTGLMVMNVANPASPQLMGSANTPGFAQDVVVSGTFAYVADHSSGLHVVNVANPASPQIVGSEPTTEPAWAVSLDETQVLRGGSNLVYVGASSRLEILDVSNPADPERVGFLGGFDFVGGMEVVDGLAFVADGLGLSIVDVSDPEDPEILDDIKTPGFAVDVAVFGDFAYVADDIGGVHVIDVSDPENLEYVGSFNSLGFVTSIVVPDGPPLAGSGPLVYAADGNAGLLILPSHCGASTGVDEMAGLGEALRLEIFPNPGSQGTIRFATTRAGLVNAAVHDVAGRRIREVFRGTLGAGSHTLDWDGCGESGSLVSAGVYFVRVSSPDGSHTARWVALH
jgi:hypothetical protein